MYGSGGPFRTLFAVMIAFAFVFTAVVIYFGGDADVEARLYPQQPQHAGYYYMDNTDPDPKVDFDWIDAANNPRSEYLEEAYNYYYSYGNYYEEYDLPFQFPFFDDVYDKCAVLACGYIDFGGFQYNGYYYVASSSSTIPYSSYENGFIAAWAYAIGSYNTPGDFRLFALEGETYGDRWVCFEWNKAYAPASYVSQPNSDTYQITFEIIIYESGLIKVQYLDADTSYSSYANGMYASAGIEDITGTKGINYCGYSDTNLKSGLAVLYGKGVAEITNYKMEADTGGALYAQSKAYYFELTAKHPINVDMIKAVAITFGNDRGTLVMNHQRRGSGVFLEEDPDDYLTLFPEKCSFSYPSGKLSVKFAFTPNFNYPTRTFERLTIGVYGVGVIPAILSFGDMYWVENQLELVGSLGVETATKDYVSNGGWVFGGEEIFFTGVKAVYPQTQISPMPGTYSYVATDEANVVWEDTSGGLYSHIRAVVENDLIRKSYSVTIGSVPAHTDVSDLPRYDLNVDPFRPSPPENFQIHSDSYEDPNTAYDDDNELFLTWQPGEDLESGIYGYYISDVDPSLGKEASTLWEFVEHPLTSLKIIATGSGVRKYYLWSVDKAMNPSTAVFAVTNVDHTPVEFREFSPGDQSWVNTHTPICSVLIDDGDGSGVSARDIQYSTSSTSKVEYGPWLRVTGVQSASELRLSVRTTFSNGKSNFIRFRAKDAAGNGWTYSPDYNVWVDEEPSLFTNFRPYEGEYQNSRVVIVSVDVTDRHGSRDGSGVVPGSIEYRYSTSGVNLFGTWDRAPVISYLDGVAKVSMELTLAEGSDNYVQFRCYDAVGNYATSADFNVKVNTVPAVMAEVSPPVNGDVYTTDEKIFFDASGTVDPDGDDLDYQWYSDIDGFLSAEVSFFRSLSPGVHDVTLMVNDPAHSEVVHFALVVKQPSQIDPATIDSDGDGLYDAWEIAYGLDPDRPDAFYDSDWDTFSNMQEFENRTNPADASSHPAYVLGEADDGSGDDDLSTQYYVLSLILAGITLIVLFVLIFLFLSKRSSFREDIDEEKDLEYEELEYRRALDSRKK
jgi:hypothetical protein